MSTGITPPVGWYGFAGRCFSSEQAAPLREIRPEVTPNPTPQLEEGQGITPAGNITRLSCFLAFPENGQHAYRVIGVGTS